jgi:hypothetical protein
MSHHCRPLGPACARAAAAVLGLAGALLIQSSVRGQSLQAERAPTRTLEIAVASPGVPGHRGGTVRRGFESLAAAREAEARAEYASADDLFREAWTDPASRAEAAAELRALHRVAAVQRVDEPAISRARRLLGEEFARFETEHFVVLSDSDAQWTTARGELLERTREQYFRVAEEMGLPVYPHRSKLLCILFNDHQAYQAFARRHDGLEARWVAGYYATMTNRVVFYNDATSPAYSAVRERIDGYEQQLRQTRTRAEEASRRRQPDQAKRLLASADDLERRIQRERSRIGRRAAAFSTAKTVHEAVHLLSFNTGMQLVDRDYPFWLSEGLATCFETEDASGPFGPDRASGLGSRRERFEELERTGRLRPLGELIALTEVPGLDGDAAEAMYSQSHAMFSYLYATDPRAVGRYIAAMLDEPGGRIGPERQRELFEAHFGSPAAIERRLVEFMRR